MLPAIAVALASCSLLVSLQSNATEIEPIGVASIKFGSAISNHSNTMWSSLEGVYSHQAEYPLHVSQLQDHQSYDGVDLVELPLHDAIADCDNGRLNLLPLNQLLSGKDSYLSEVVANGVQPCSLGHSVWASVVAYKEIEFDAKSTPVLIQDFFNTDAYPGKRAMIKSPRAIVEWALLNRGYPSNQIYTVLDLQLAWKEVKKSLDAIGSANIVWVESDRQALDLIDSGEATFAAVSSKSLVRKIASQFDSWENRYGVIWNGAIAHMSMLAIPKQSASVQALRLLRFVTDPTRNVQMTTSYGYAPVHTEQVVFIEDRFLRALPVGAQLDNLMWGNSKWWREKGAAMERLFFEYFNESDDAPPLALSPNWLVTPEHVVANNI